MPDDNLRISWIGNQVQNSKGTLVFLHGLGGDSTSWNDIRSQLYLESYNSLALDLRGHGHSSRPEKIEAYSLEELSQDVEAVISRIEGPFILVGHCLGGMVALQVASQIPVSALILVNTSARPWQPLFPASTHVLECIFAWLARIAPRWHVATYPDYTKFRHSSDFDLARLFSDVTHTSLKSYFSLMHEVLRVDVRSKLASITAPTLLLCGDSDRIFRIKHAHFLQDHLKDSSLKIIRNGNHVMIWDHAEEIAQEISDFLK